MSRNIAAIACCIVLLSCGETKKEAENNKTYNNVADVPTLIQRGYKGPVKSIKNDDDNIFITEYDREGRRTGHVYCSGTDTYKGKAIYINNRLEKIINYNSENRVAVIQKTFWLSPYHYTKYLTEEDTAKAFESYDTYTNRNFMDSFWVYKSKWTDKLRIQRQDIFYNTDNTVSFTVTDQTDTVRHIYTLKDEYGNPGKVYLIDTKENDTTITKYTYEYYQ
jgi:hypothetical protein